MKPEPDAPGSSNPTDGGGWVDAGSWKYRISGSVQVDIIAGHVGRGEGSR